jgi:ubiquitin-protein ligase
MSTVRLRRLQADYDKLQEYVNHHPRLQLIQVDGSPPERYQLEYQIRGLRQTDEDVSVVKSHMVEIALPLSYPRLPPQCRMLTPIFHPNIAPHAICIGDHWSPGEPLWSIVARIGEMIAYQSYNTKSPLNGEAARWVDENLRDLPLDAVSMMPDDVEPSSSAAARPAVRQAVPRPSGQVPPVIDAAATIAQTSVHVPSYNLMPPPEPQQARTDSPARVPPQPASDNDRTIACPNCGVTLRLRPELIGKQVRCLRCRTVFKIPAP